jgi:Ca2+-binding RTX toxin-like protein
MASTNYQTTISKEITALTNSALPPNVAKAILASLAPTALVDNFFISDQSHNLAPSDLKGHNIVYSYDDGVINLNNATVADVANLNALIFNNSTPNQDGIDLTMNNGAGAAAFKGWVVTYATDDKINLSGSGVKVSSGDGNDSVTTGTGNDSIIAGGGNDTVISGSGNDTISTGNGNDNINSGAGDDSVVSGNGNDTVFTGIGNDTVNTGSGNDSVNTGAGHDSIIVGNGNDTVIASDGNDIVRLENNYTGNAKLYGGTGANTLDLSGVIINSVTKSGNAVTITLLDDSVITATSFGTFIYDSNGTDAGGSVEIVGVNAFDALDFLG